MRRYVDLYPPVFGPASWDSLIQHSIQLIGQVIKHVPDVIQNVPCRLDYVRNTKRDTTGFIRSDKIVTI